MNRRFIRDDSAVFHNGIAIPANTATLSSAVELGAGGQAGAIAVVFQAKTTIIIATSKIVTAYISSSTASGGTYVTDATFAKTASGTLTYNAGDVICELIIPRTSSDFVKASIGTDDTGATGTIDVFASFVAR